MDSVFETGHGNGDNLPARVANTHAEETGHEFSTGRGVEGAGKYRVVREGLHVYIVDVTGRKVTEGYRSFDIFTSTDADGNELKGLIGEKMGGIKYVLKPPTAESPNFQPSKEGFHELTYRPDIGGYFVMKTGSMSRIVDAEGRYITSGYFDFFMRDGKLYGGTATKEEEINLQQDESPFQPEMLEHTASPHIPEDKE